ncbi:bifunctional pyr operon transcriptional regulator/uracil phosphoribosyltransferase PyrR [Pontibacter sp. G13]|uniref:bifunctional pyr operon transcriptional regulator/uracil phosphoribosyltransferase PyrR n=1 Tax=Pontibacter sp. G13 TaxID=3074898 RepID=UPI00288BA2E1|nr:bifunctional pyr operon transcriptional regulator/uracil phosphoribosyltransferase PyrR [Pontibacter sp. G13]WNJ20518.1 bifunctional pyr operon transcriptional regulator/uracil phosphoribosyltransferase PyrR [Pontibacter sp. G13]
METSEQLDLFPQGKLQLTLRRLCHQLVENYGDFSDTILLGAQPRGKYLARRIKQILEELNPTLEIPIGELDATFFRDDFRMREKPLEPNRTHIDFLIENKRVIMVDDVLYTGRTVRAGMDAMLAFGRPKTVELLVLVDRKHQRELPIEASYIGITVDTIDSQRIRVELKESGGQDQVFLVSKS